MTIASAPASTCGHHASTWRRMRSSGRLLGVQVVLDRAAAARLRHAHERDAQPVEHARRGGVDVGGERGLHAAVQHDHPPRVPRGRPRARLALRRHLPREGGGQERAEDPAQRHAEGEERPGEEGEAQQPAEGAVGERARHLLLHQGAADVHEPAVLDARRAGGLARAAGEAAVEVHLRLRGHGGALERLLHEVDAPARAVELVAQQVVGRARGEAEAAVHALAQDRVGLAGPRACP